MSVPDEGIKLGRDGVPNEAGGFAKLQPDELLVLQLADDAIVDGQPVDVGDEQLAGQQAAFVYQGIVGLRDVIFLTTCMENKAKKEENQRDLDISHLEIKRTACGFLLHPPTQPRKQ